MLSVRLCKASSLPTVFGVAFIFIAMFAFLLPSKFLTNKFLLSTDTLSYTNEPGISSGFGLDNLSSYLRPPGYPLFFLLTTLGKIPHPDTIVAAACGNTVWGASGSCDAAASRLKTDIAVRMDPLIFGYSAATAHLFQRTIEISRILFILSIMSVFVVISKRFAITPSIICVLSIVYFLFFKGPNGLDILGTESLFPTILFFYLSAFLQYLRTRSVIWLCVATALIIYAFLVRPAYIYMPFLHLIATIIAASNFGKWRHFVISAAITAPVFIWFVFYSPVLFFSAASHDAALLRTAVLADQQTVNCVANPAERTLLRAYVNTNEEFLKSIGEDPDGADYVQRYYALGPGNLYRIALKTHPIYRQPGVERILVDGSIPNSLINGMLASAERCDRWRNLIYSALNVAMMTGLTPVLVPKAPHYFFQGPYIFWISASFILLAIAWSLAAYDGWSLSLAAMPSVLYFGTIVIVAVEQGGEARYSLPVEPLYVLSAIASFFFVIGELNRIVKKRWPNSLIASAGRAVAVTPISARAAFVERYRSKLTLSITSFMLLLICGYYFVLWPLFTFVPVAVKGRNQQRMSDMQNLKDALSAYYKEYKSYPAAPAGDCPGMSPSYDNLGGLAGVLVPKYIKAIPHDPRPASCGYNYMYFSDGKDFAIMTRPEDIDPTVYSDRWCIGADSGPGRRALPGISHYWRCP